MVPEPATTTGATGWAVAAGLCSAFLAAVGIGWDLVFWSSAGSFIGAGWAPKTGRLRAVLTFAASTVLAAKAGTIAAAWWGPIGALPAGELAQGCAGLAGILFHPLVARLVRQVDTAELPLPKRPQE